MTTTLSAFVRVFCCSALLASAVALAPQTSFAASDTEVNAFAKCISDSGAKFYGAYWCGFCNKQKAMFGESAKSLPYVECYEPGTKTKRATCSAIGGFPTWIFKDGTERPGMLSMSALAASTGCTAPPVD